MMAFFISEFADVDPSAVLGDEVEIKNRARVGPGTTLTGPVILKDSADLEGVTIDAPCIMTFGSDAFVRSDDDWFLTEPDPEFRWTVYKTARSGPGGSIWQASASCVTDVDLDKSNFNWNKSRKDSGEHKYWLPEDVAGTHVGQRTAHMALVKAEIAQRNSQ